MLHHVELYVGNLEKSVAFWEPFMNILGYQMERWSGGVNFVRGKEETYFCLLQASEEHLAAGYHRKRIGLNHLAFKGKSRAQVDEVTTWLRQAGHCVLYEDRHPFAGGRNYYAVFLEDPDRIKLEVVAPIEN